MRKIRNDIILIIVSLIIVFGLFTIWAIAKISYEPLLVNIYYKDDLLYSVPLDINKEIIVKGEISDVKIIIEGGYVSVVESGCENQICVHEGKKNHKFDTITCLPNYIYVKLVER